MSGNWVQNKLQQIKQSQLRTYFDNRDTGTTKVWQTKEWKEKRAELIGDECEWCGDDNDDTVFQLHHDNFSKPNYDALWEDATDYCYVHSHIFNPEYVDVREECPNCGLCDFYARKTKTPTYRCNNCKATFEQPTQLHATDLAQSTSQRVSYYTTKQYDQAKLDWLQTGTNATKARHKFDELVTQEWKHYKSLADTITICKSCHFQHHKRGRTFCDNCESTWHSTKYDMCWDCIVDENGLEKCPECEDNWYSPNKYDSCKNCR